MIIKRISNWNVGVNLGTERSKKQLLPMVLEVGKIIQWSKFFSNSLTIR